MDQHELIAVPWRGAEHVDAALARYFSLSRTQAGKYGHRFERLWDVIERNTTGGKRFRPRMVMAAYTSLGGADLEAAAQLAAAYEMLHTALIVHDDVIDRDFVRRGHANVSGSYRDIATTAGIPLPAAEHRGMSAAVIAGDLALSGAYRLVDRTGAADNVRFRLREILDDAVTAAAAGELADVDFSLSPRPPSVDDIVEMERQKTAVYSFEAPLQSGAVLAGAFDETIDELGEFGRNIGIAYQIVDDILGVFGRQESTGKSTLGDLREGKRTVLTAQAFSSELWGSVADLFGKSDLNEDEAARIRGVLVDSGAKGFAERLAADFANRAWEHLASDAIPASLRDELSPVVRKVLERVR
ncbi:polyprenyl synthetase family protein [Mycetocola zhadangensis]|uniref:Polyprenyl synthetase family protein n=1 Tax=Mycetocola zhadangensis TaxID=1164595 RepID=A0A3L7J713_9MICO|nr:polyprenyl synthetase family protein [Mycetocola zhadangensis]RLQ86155.1 polyprenyl synthetase family protein [Mycetocola zhadangensis]GGE88844.1 geranylgeranyl pyrophosphate synthase [Mycetocola zhadangensis]